jgi:hypothetical protein
MSNTKGESSYARSPTQASFHHSPGGRSQHSKPSTPLQPTLNGTLHSPNSPHTALPSIASAVYPRETPVSNYYDPTQDTGDRGISRGGARIEAYGHDVCILSPSSMFLDGKITWLTTNYANQVNSAEKVTTITLRRGFQCQGSTRSLIHYNRRSSRTFHRIIRHHTRQGIHSRLAVQTPWRSLLYRHGHTCRTTSHHLNSHIFHMSVALL